MALTMSIYNTFSIYTLLLITISHLVSTNASQIDDICGQTTNPPLCILALGGRQAEGSSLQGLAAAGLLSAVRDATTSKIKFEKLLDSSPRPDLNSQFTQCKNIYDEIRETIVAAQQALRLGGLDQAAASVATVLGSVDQCEDLFIGTSPAHELSSSVRAAVEAVLVISKTPGN